MKNFTDICRMSQTEVKAYMKDYLKTNKYEVVDDNGFLYAKGNAPVLLVAHMDTVHKLPCCEIKETNGKISSPQGIGGDDRCGVFIIMNIVNEIHCSVLLCEDEEIGTVGARKFAQTKYVKDLDVNYIIEFDRKGNNDAVFYDCDNEKFTEFVTSITGFKKEYGSFSDISVVAPEAKIAAVNLSCGYYKPHTTDEYVVYDEMMNTVNAAKILILTESEKFEYIKKKFENNYYNKNSYQQMTFDDYAADDLMLCLEVVFDDGYGEEVVEECGNTKVECWAKFFLNNPDVCYNMITDYNFY